MRLYYGGQKSPKTITYTQPIVQFAFAKIIFSACIIEYSSIHKP